MSVRAARCWLFALLLVTAPWPFVLFGDAPAPPLRSLWMALAATAVVASEGASVTVRLILGVLWGQTLLAFGGCWVIAWGLARGASALGPRIRRRIVIALIVLALGVASALPIYRTPMGTRLHSNLWQALS